MRRKHKAFVLILLLFVSAATVGGCSTSLEGNPNPNVVTADDGGKEEVLDQDDADDPFDRSESAPESGTAQGTARGILLSVGYVAMTIGSAVLPLLMFL